MNQYIDKIVRYAFTESQIYGESPLTSIYYLSLFDRYCEVEVRSLLQFKKSIDLDNWIPELTFNYSRDELDKSSKESLSYQFIAFNRDNSNKEQIKPRFLRKRDLLYESIILSNNRLPPHISQYWIETEYGKVTCSYNLTAGVDLAIVPTLTILDLLKFTNKNIIHNS